MSDYIVTVRAFDRIRVMKVRAGSCAEALHRARQECGIHLEVHPALPEMERVAQLPEMERVAQFSEQIRQSSVPDWQRRGFLRAEKPTNDEHSFGL